jgi:hypothetical protein
LADTVARVNGDNVDLCFSMEMPFMPDYQLNERFTELMTQAGIDFCARVGFKSTANSHDLFGALTPILDSVVRGAELSIELDVWKDFALSQIELFNDKNMFGLGVTYLFGTVPFSMSCLSGDLQVNIDERAVEILKLKPIGKKLCAMPAQFVMSDEQYLLRIMDLKMSNIHGVDAVIAQIWRYCGSEL